MAILCADPSVRIVHCRASELKVWYSQSEVRVYLTECTVCGRREEHVISNVSPLNSRVARVLKHYRADKREHKTSSKSGEGER